MFPEPPAVPAVPEVPAVPAVPALPELPALPAVPALPELPALPAVPAVPALPELPALPALPELPASPVVSGSPELHPRTREATAAQANRASVRAWDQRGEVRGSSIVTSESRVGASVAPGPRPIGLQLARWGGHLTGRAWPDQYLHENTASAPVYWMAMSSM